MNHLLFPALGSATNNDRTGCPTVAGLTLAPVPPATFEQFRMIAGNSVRALTALEAEGFLLTIVAEAQTLATAYLKSLEGHVSRVGALLDEAAKLAKSPGVGDEGAIIRAHAATVAAWAAEPKPALKHFEHLRRHVAKVGGFDPSRVVDAIAKYDDEIERARHAVDQLEQAQRSLFAHAEASEDPASLDAARTKRVNARLSRALPGAMADLQTIRGETAALLGRVDAVLATLAVVS